MSMPAVLRIVGRAMSPRRLSSAATQCTPAAPMRDLSRVGLNWSLFTIILPHRGLYLTPPVFPPSARWLPTRPRGLQLPAADPLRQRPLPVLFSHTICLALGLVCTVCST